MCYELVRTKEQFDAVYKKLDPTKPLFCDTETMEQQGYTKPKGGLYGSVRLFQIYQYGWPKAILFDCYYIDLQKILYTIQAFHHVGHNYSYDLHTINCHTASTFCPDRVDDTFYLSKAKFTDKQKFDFYSCLRWAKIEDDKIRNIDKKANQKFDWSGCLTEDQLIYAAYDVLYLSLLYKKIEDAKDEPYELDIKNLRHAVNYNRRGLPMNRNTVSEIRKEQMILLETAMQHVPINPNSHVQCKQWLGFAKSDADTLANAALRGNTDAQWLLKAKKSSKILSFCTNYDRDRVRAFHNACGARTSRMTCSGGDRYGYVNLQQPPRRLYAAMEASPGHDLVYADFSGLELRMVGAYVGEPKLEAFFKAGIDVHTKTAAEIYGITEEEVTEQQRWSAKMVSFTTIYGGGAVTVQGIMQKQGGKLVDLDEVVQIQKRWLEIYDYVREWHKMHGKMLRVYGYIDTVTLLERTIRAFTYTESFNFPIQGSGAEVLKFALNRLHTYDDDDPKIVNVVHDSITMEHLESESAEWGVRLTEAMMWGWQQVIQHASINDMPMKVDTVVSKVMGVRDDATEAYDYGVSDL